MHLTKLFSLGLLSSALLTNSAFASPTASAAQYDFLARQNLRIDGSDPSGVFERTADDLQSVFEKYEPALDSDTRIISPLKVGGSRSRPTISITLEKCVFFVCKTVKMDAVISVEEKTKSSPGACERNVVMSIDLSRSSPDLSDVYDQIDVGICLAKNNLGLNAQARQAPGYTDGMIQQEIFKLLKKQIQPITRALDETLKENVR